MVYRHKVAGYEDFEYFMSNLKTTTRAPIYVYFTGSKDAAGKSWCPDCNDAEPFVENAIKTLAASDSHFIFVDVGDRVFWKNMKNPFRLDKKAYLMVIPTLVDWNNSFKRLVGNELCKQDLLEMFFEQQ